MPDSVTQWLQRLGLGQYADAFAENAIEWDQLSRLSDDELRELGVTALGHRKRIREFAETIPAELPIEPDRTSPVTGAGEAERRQLTVMFIDLVGSTELSRQLDPEELREVLRAYQDVLREEVARYGGHVARYIGDGGLVYFGYPQAHEDDAVRAIYAGLALTRAVKQLGKRLLQAHGGRLRARVGIATGPVVVGDLVGTDGAETDAVTGETPNLAARLQDIATSGRVAIAEQTRALAGDAFTYEAPEERTLKGFPEPVQLWRVLGPSGTQSRFEALHGRWLTPMVGREHEIGLLLERWRQAKDGEGQVVLISGEAGIGKSRITEVLHERLLAEEHIRVRLQCSPYHTNSALYPVIEQLEHAARFTRDEPAASRLEKLEALIRQSSNDTIETTVPLLAALLSIPTGQRYPPLAMTPERQKERTLAVLTDQLSALALHKPLLIIFEDAHWIDPTTLELIDLVVDRAEHARMLVGITFRPEFEPPWIGRPHTTLLALNRLSKRQGAELAGEVAGGRGLPPEVLEQLVARTDGVPLFVEELTRMVLESGMLKEQDGQYVLDGPLPPLAIPATLQDSLMARLDRLAPAKQVAQTAAAIGRSFRHDLLAAVAGLDESKLTEALGQLVDAGLVFRQGVPPAAVYTFKHALVQVAAYESLLKSQRLRIHARIGNVMETKFSLMANAAPDVVAQHFIEAELIDPAISWSTKAGIRAFERAANLEAISSFRKAIALIEALPDRETHREAELDILMALGTVLTAAKGYADPDTNETYVRARELCHEIEDLEKSINVLYGVWSCYVGLGQYDRSWSIAMEAQDLVANSNSYAQEFCATFMVAYEEQARGKFQESYQSYANFHDEYVPSRDEAFSFRLTEHIGLLIGAYQGHLNVFIGHLDHVLPPIENSIARLKDVNHTNSIGNALFFYGTALHELGLNDQLLTTSNELIKYATDNVVTLWLFGGLILKGVALSRLGSPDEALAVLREGLDGWLSSRAGFQVPQLYAYLAAASLVAGRFDAGMAAAFEGLRRARQNDENFYSAELHRIHGELLQMRDVVPPHEVETRFKSALELARTQGSHTFELRAATSLARLWAERGERQRAHDLLFPVYTWFTEGLDSHDLIAAKALLVQLNSLH